MSLAHGFGHRIKTFGNPDFCGDGALPEFDVEKVTMVIPIAHADHVEEPGGSQEYAEILSRVALSHSPVIVRRAGNDLAAVVPIDYLELLHELVSRQEAERLAAQVNSDRTVSTSPPAQEWFEREEPKPF